MSELSQLKDLSHRAYEHPSGRAALAAVRRGPKAITKIVDLVGARRMRTIYLAGALRISDKQLPEVWAVFEECCRLLDLLPPELYVSRDPGGHTGALGTDEPFIVLSAATLKLFEAHPSELRFLLGREIGHVLSGHSVYNSALGLLLRTRTTAASVPVLGLAVHGGIAVLKDWNDDAALSADRAGLLCAQDVEACREYFTKMAGGEWAEIDEEAFLAQEDDYRESKGALDTVVKLISSSTVDSPRYVLRYSELRQWIDSGEYGRILGGDYARRSQDDAASFKEEAGVTWSHLKSKVRGKTSAVSSLFRRRGER